MDAEIIRVEDHAIQAATPTGRLEEMEAVVKFMAGKCAGPEFIADIRGKRYPTVNWWTTVGAALGIIAREVSCVPLEDGGGYEATTELWRHGEVVGRGSAICRKDERSKKGWDEYAVRSMAITRATGKAFRVGFSFLAVMAGLEATPAEEMPSGAVRAPEPAPESGQPIRQTEDAGALEAVLVDAELKQGTNARGEWSGMRFTTQDGEEFMSFHASDFPQIEKAVEDGAPVIITWHRGPRNGKVQVDSVVYQGDVTLPGMVPEATKVPIAQERFNLLTKALRLKMKGLTDERAREILTEWMGAHGYLIEDLQDEATYKAVTAEAREEDWALILERETG